MTEYNNERGTRWKVKESFNLGWGIIRIPAHSRGNYILLIGLYRSEQEAQDTLDEMARRKGYTPIIQEGK